MVFTLSMLPYGYSDLEPYIDVATMTLHHTKHHQTYVDNLNKALDKYPDLAKNTIEELLKIHESLPGDIKQAVVNNGGGHANHSFFWKIMKPKSSAVLSKGNFLDAVNSTFGNMDKFKEAFTTKAMSVFGSGWAFLIKTPDGKLLLKRHSFQNSPLMHGNIPILGIDVWEHAYYLKYQNRKAEYITAWWNVVNWEQVEKNYLSLKG